MTTPRQHHDTAWKDVVTRHLFAFLEFYFPSVLREIDTVTPPRFLDKELSRIIRTQSIPDRYADLLVEVRRATGSSRMVCHVEVQGSPVTDFEHRLVQYAYRIYEKVGVFPLTLVVLTEAGFLEREVVRLSQARGRPVADANAVFRGHCYTPCGTADRRGSAGSAIR